MSSDNQYTALGPAVIGFQTDATRIDRGADISGNEFGVRGSSFNGAGVIGESTNQVGVEGRGETGIVGHGIRGPGVEGIGGRRSDIPEAGIIGQGGRKPDQDNAQRQLHGTGVIGIAGGRSRLNNEEAIIGSVGVFGQGAEAEVRTVGETVHGPRTPGAGVVGRGGQSIPLNGQVAGAPAPGVIGFAGGTDGLLQVDSGGRGDVGVYGVGGTGVTGAGTKGAGVEGLGSSGNGFGGSRGVVGPGVVGRGGSGFDPRNPQRFEHGAGIIGIASDAPLPPFSETSETGVYGAGQNGVKGIGAEGRGGIFQSELSAQVQLIPAKGSRTAEQTAFTPRVIANPEKLGPELPKVGRGGDLMTIVDDQGQCTLWFCVQDGTDAGAARWAQVLLGPLFDGRG